VSQELNLSNPWNDITPSLRRFIHRHVRSAQSAEDIFQEAILRLEAHRDRLPAPELRLPWALRIARNLVIDQRRAAKLRQHGSLDVDVPLFESAADRNSQKELAHCLAAMIERLPDLYRLPLRLADMEGIDQHIIARQLNLSPSGLRSRVQRGRSLLRHMILGCCEIEQSPRGDIVDYRPRPHCRQACAGLSNDDLRMDSCVILPTHPSTGVSADESAEVTF
jgi:RNA polymerase sigma-70 factor (ECF subfamily)